MKRVAGTLLIVLMVSFGLSAQQSDTMYTRAAAQLQSTLQSIKLANSAVHYLRHTKNRSAPLLDCVNVTLLQAESSLADVKLKYQEAFMQVKREYLTTILGLSTKLNEYEKGCNNTDFPYPWIWTNSTKRPVLDGDSLHGSIRYYFIRY